MTTEQKTTNRRGALGVLAGLVAVAGGWQAWVRRPSEIEFQAIKGVSGWQIAELGTVSASPSEAILLGLDDDVIDPLPVSELDRAVFDAGRKLAVFSDAFCPYCRVLVPSLEARYPGGVTYHALPFFGPFSERVARAAVAAELQGDQGNMHVLMHTMPVRPTPTFFARVADDNGLDGDRIVQDMDSDVVSDAILRSRRAAERLQIWGTPAVAVGRKVVLGSIDMTVLDDLVTA